MKKAADHFLPYALPVLAVGFFLIAIVIGTTIGLAYAVDYLRHGQPPTAPTMTPSP